MQTYPQQGIMWFFFSYVPSTHMLEIYTLSPCKQLVYFLDILTIKYIMHYS